MRRGRDARRLLRWYPEGWRERYGEEFVALLEDTVGDASPAFSLRCSVAVAGLRERCYESGIVGERSSAQHQRRTGSLVVLVAWAVMAIGGLSLVKAAEHFSNSLPVGSRNVAQLAYDTVAAGSVFGTLLVALGAGVALGALVRLLRGGGWAQVREPLSRGIVVSVLMAVATVGLSAWAHHLGSVQRNGGNLFYSGAFVLYAFLVVLTVGVWTRGFVTVATILDLSPRVLRWESALAVGVTVSTVVVTASAVTWWVQMGLHASWFLEGSSAGVSASPWSAGMIVTVAIMLVAMMTALWGLSRVVLTYRLAR